MNKTLRGFCLLVAATLCAASGYTQEIGGVNFSFNEEDGTATVVEGGDYSGSIVIPAEVLYEGRTYRVTAIGDYAFGYCDQLTSVTLPSTVETIGECAFRDCYCLTSVTLPEGLTSIGSSAFQTCEILTSIVIPEGVTSIGEYAFCYCKTLTSVTIPASVASIGSGCFRDCEQLAEIKMETAQPPSLDSYTLSGLADNCVIYVPQNTAEAYSVEPWSQYAIEEYVPAVRLTDGKPFGNPVERPVAPLTTSANSQTPTGSHSTCHSHWNMPTGRRTST